MVRKGFFLVDLKKRRNVTIITFFLKNEEISLSIIITVSLLLILVQESTCFGFVDYNDECEFVEFGDPSTFVSRLEEWKYCDTNRGLFCVPGLGRCGCLVPLTIYRGGKCRAKVDAGIDFIISFDFLMQFYYFFSKVAS